MLRHAVFALIMSMAGASLAQAQGDAPAGAQPGQQPFHEPPRDLMVAPSPAEKTPPSAQTDPGRQSAGVPANICTELAAYLKQKEAQPPSPAVGPGKVAQEAPADKSTAGPGQTAPPMDQVQQRSGLSAPIPHDDSASGAPPLSMDEARKLAEGNDLRGCQGAVRQMRRAGMALPLGLLALAALREDLLAKSQPPAEQNPKP